MAAIVVQSVVGKYPVTPLVANVADLTFAATELAGDTFPNSGKELIILRNDDAAPQTITITSQVDEKNRLGSISAYSVGIGEYAIFGPFPPSAWNDPNTGLLNLLSSDVDLMIAVVRITL